MRLGQWLGLLALLASLYVLWQVRSLVFLFFTAVIFAIALNRFVRRLQKSGASRGTAIALAVGTCLTVSGLFLTCIIVPLSSQFAQLDELIPFGIDQIRKWNDQLQAIVPGEIPKNVLNLDDFSTRLQQVANWLMLHLYLFFSNSLALVLNILLIVVLTLMLLVNPKQYRKLLIQVFPAFYRQRINDILSICESKLVHYVLVLPSA